MHRVLVKPNEIGEIPEIFQPREFTLGLRDHDRVHVNPSITARATHLRR